MNIVFTGGGTGGHVIPIIAIARELRRAVPAREVRFLYVGPKDDFAQMLLSQEGFEMRMIMAGKIRRYAGVSALAQTFFDLVFRIPVGIVQAFAILYGASPDLVFSKGGFGSIPVILAAKLLGIPVFLHESDVVPGIANRVTGRVALEIFTSFPKTRSFPLRKMISVGNPIRTELLGGSAEEAQRLWKLKGGKPRMFILGGSQGSQRINDMLLVIIGEMLKDFEVIHQTGEKNFVQIRKEAQVMIPGDLADFYHPVPFLKETELKHAYAAADLIVGRAGGGSIFEIAALGKPSILIPLPEAAQDHQIQNAYAYARTGAALVLEESNLTPHFFLEKVRSLFSSPEELERMARAARGFARPEAAKVIASYLVEYLKE